MSPSPFTWRDAASSTSSTSSLRQRCWSQSRDQTGLKAKISDSACLKVGLGVGFGLSGSVSPQSRSQQFGLVLCLGLSMVWSRSTSRLLINLIFPCLLIYAVSFLGFFLPVESGEKVNLEITRSASRSKVKRKPRDHDPAGARRLPADCRGDAAADAWCHPSARWVGLLPHQGLDTAHELNWPATIGPSYMHVNHARQRHDLIGCSETRTLSAWLVLNTCIPRRLSILENANWSSV